MRRALAVLLLVCTVAGLSPAGARAQVPSFGTQVWNAVGGPTFFSASTIVALASAGATVSSTAVCVLSGWCGVVIAGSALITAAYAWKVTTRPTSVGSQVTWFDASGYYYRVRLEYADGRGLSTYNPCWPGGIVTGSTAVPVYRVEYGSSVVNSCYGGMSGSVLTTDPGGSGWTGMRGASGYNPSSEQAARDWAANPANVSAVQQGIQGAMGARDAAGLPVIGVTGSPPFADANPPAVGNPPSTGTAPGTGTDVPTQGSQGGLFQWLGDLLRNLIEWLSAQFNASIVWLGNVLNGAIAGVRSGVQVVGQKVDGVKEAVIALPTQIADAIGTKLATLFTPSPATLDQWKTLPTLMQSKPPWSLLPPASMFPDPGGGGCALPALPAGPLGIQIVWPGFVCDLASLVRQFMLGVMWIGIAGWFYSRFFPRPSL